MSTKIEPLEIEDSKVSSEKSKSGFFLTYKKLTFFLVIFSAIFVACILATYFGKPDKETIITQDVFNNEKCNDFYCKNVTLLQCKESFLYKYKSIFKN